MSIIFPLIRMKRRIAVFDPASVNFAYALVEHTPAERRRKNIAQDILEEMHAPLEEQTRLLVARVINLKGGRLVGQLDARRTDHPITVGHRIPHPADVGILDVCGRGGEWLQRFTELFEEPIPDVFIEPPGSMGADSIWLWQLVGAVRGAIGFADADLGIVGRRVAFAQKKADVKRGTAYVQHKADSIKAMREHAQRTGDDLAVRFMDELTRTGQKLDDLADCYNMARAADDQPPPQFLVPQRKKKRLRDRVRPALKEPPAKRRRRHDSLWSSSEDSSAHE